MIDLRYHFATIAVIFLALGIGMVIGTTFIDNDFLLHEQEKLIDRLENDFSTLRQQNQLAKEEIAQLKDTNQTLVSFTRELYPLFFSDKFDNFSLAIFTFGQYDHQNDLVETLEKAGLKVKLFDLQLEKMIDLNGKLPADLTAMDMKLEEFFSRNNNLAEDFQDEFNNILVLGGSKLDNDLLNIFYIPFIKYLSKEQRNNVIVGDFSKIENNSYLKLLQDLGVCSVENLDSIVGQTALMLILLNNPEQPINFAVNSGCENLLSLIKK